MFQKPFELDDLRTAALNFTQLPSMTRIKVEEYASPDLHRHVGRGR